MIDDVFDDYDPTTDALICGFAAMLKREEERQRRRRNVSLAILVLSLVAVCAIAWVLR